MLNEALYPTDTQAAEQTPCQNLLAFQKRKYSPFLIGQAKQNEKRDNIDSERSPDTSLAGSWALLLGTTSGSASEKAK